MSDDRSCRSVAGEDGHAPRVVLITDSTGAALEELERSLVVSTNPLIHLSDASGPPRETPSTFIRKRSPNVVHRPVFVRTHDQDFAPEAMSWHGVSEA